MYRKDNKNLIHPHKMCNRHKMWGMSEELIPQKYVDLFSQITKYSMHIGQKQSIICEQL